VLNRLADLDGAELTGSIDGSLLKKFFTHYEGIHCALEISTTNTTREEDLEEFEGSEVGEEAGQKYIEG